MAERYEREIEEILRNAADLGTANRPIPIRPRVVRPAPPRVGGFLARLMPSGQMMLASMVLALLAFGMQSRPGPALTILVVAAVVCFIVGYVWAFRGPRNLGSDRRWRGQVIDYSPSVGADFGIRLRRWWERVSRR